MTTGQRSILSFLDLALIMTGVMAMLVTVGDEHEATAAALSEQFGLEDALRNEHPFAVSRFFEPQDARLTDAGKTALQRFAKLPETTRLQISVPVLAEDDAGRLSHWEISAARTAAIMYQLNAIGISEQRISPQMEQLRAKTRKDKSTPDIMIITIKDKDAKQK